MQNNFLLIHISLCLILYLLIYKFLAKSKCKKAAIIEAVILGTIPIINIFYIMSMLRLIFKNPYIQHKNKDLYFDNIVRFSYTSLILNSLFLISNNTTVFVLMVTLTCFYILFEFFFRDKLFCKNLEQKIAQKLDIDIGNSKEELEYKLMNKTINNVIITNTNKSKNKVQKI